MGGTQQCRSVMVEPEIMAWHRQIFATLLPDRRGSAFSRDIFRPQKAFELLPGARQFDVLQQTETLWLLRTFPLSMSIEIMTLLHGDNAETTNNTSVATTAHHQIAYKTSVISFSPNVFVKTFMKLQYPGNENANI